LPFLVADIDMVVAGRAPPVDAGHGLAFDIGTELPEILADAAAAAAVPAGDHRVGDAPRLDQQVGHQRGAQPRPRNGIARGNGGRRLADARHHSAAFTSRAMTSRTLTP